MSHFITPIYTHATVIIKLGAKDENKASKFVFLRRQRFEAGEREMREEMQ